MTLYSIKKVIRSVGQVSYVFYVKCTIVSITIVIKLKFVEKDEINSSGVMIF